MGSAVARPALPTGTKNRGWAFDGTCIYASPWNETALPHAKREPGFAGSSGGVLSDSPASCARLRSEGGGSDARSLFFRPVRTSKTMGAGAWKPQVQTVGKTTRKPWPPGVRTPLSPASNVERPFPSGRQADRPPARKAYLPRPEPPRPMRVGSFHRLSGLIRLPCPGDSAACNSVLPDGYDCQSALGPAAETAPCHRHLATDSGKRLRRGYILDKAQGAAGSPCPGGPWPTCRGSNSGVSLQAGPFHRLPRRSGCLAQPRAA